MPEPGGDILNNTDESIIPSVRGFAEKSAELVHDDLAKNPKANH